MEMRGSSYYSTLHVGVTKMKVKRNQMKQEVMRKGFKTNRTREMKARECERGERAEQMAGGERGLGTLHVKPCIIEGQEVGERKGE